MSEEVKQTATEQLNYKQLWLDNFMEILKKCFDDEAAFGKISAYIDKAFENSNITGSERVKIRIQTLNDIVNNFTTIAANNASLLTRDDLLFSITKEGAKEQNRTLKLKNDQLEAEIPIRKAGLQLQNSIAQAQLSKFNKDSELVGAQTSAIRQQVSDNRLIKSISALGEYISQTYMGGMDVPADMNKYYFKLIGNLTGDTSNLPSKFDIPKKK